ncbi:hypothetical protein WICPIJ_009043 [Wickerhamomyces pijperi]|uniref:Uncharacterized protein n=1 Tax=Wickerhamomyces pijperi TaxID=599730 RepID=A0A9P8PS13_WICPI|nr:hypothetical protein WICPIJ_009043 [Wickerhamomyces pijperi]
MKRLSRNGDCIGRSSLEPRSVGLGSCKLSIVFIFATFIIPLTVLIMTLCNLIDPVPLAPCVLLLQIRLITCCLCVKWAHHLWKNIIHQDPAHSALTRKEVYAPHWRRDEDAFIDINWFVHTILEVRRQRRFLLSADAQNLISQELTRVLNAKLREYEYTEL